MTCVAVVVGNSYQCYIPLFAYFVFKSYPDYSLRVFLTDKFDSKYRGIVSELDAYGDIRIIGDYFSDIKVSDPQELKTLRWLIREDQFKDFYNVYIGDVDLLICKEKEPLDLTHTLHCIVNSLPYSNCIRTSGDRLSGLHFIIREKYYDSMSNVIERYRKYLCRGKLKGIRNEKTLYNMCKEIGLPRKEHRIDYKGSGPHHGLHLGLWRGDYRKFSIGVYDHFKHDNYMNNFEYYKSLENDYLFKKCAKFVPKNILKDMNECMNSLREKYVNI